MFFFFFIYSSLSVLEMSSTFWLGLSDADWRILFEMKGDVDILQVSVLRSVYIWRGSSGGLEFSSFKRFFTKIFSKKIYNWNLKQFTNVSRNTFFLGTWYECIQLHYVFDKYYCWRTYKVQNNFKLINQPISKYKLN